MDQITEDQVIELYGKALRTKVREQENWECETPSMVEERMDAICEHATLELQYLAQAAR